MSVHEATANYEVQECFPALGLSEHHSDCVLIVDHIEMGTEHVPSCSQVSVGSHVGMWVGKQSIVTKSLL